MAVSGLEQRAEPLIDAWPNLWRPWGPLFDKPPVPTDSDSDCDAQAEEVAYPSFGPAEDAKMLRRHLFEPRRVRTWGDYVPYSLKQTACGAHDFLPPSKRPTAVKGVVDPSTYGSSSLETFVGESSDGGHANDDEEEDEYVPDPSSEEQFLEDSGADGDEHDPDPATVEPLPEGTTTLMVRNVPLCCSPKRLLEEIDRSGFRGRYDFCYAPYNFKSHNNRGYAFVNFVDSSTAALFMAKWQHSRRLIQSVSNKPLDVKVAEVQGREANLRKACTGKIMRIRNSDYRPYVRSTEDGSPE